MLAVDLDCLTECIVVKCPLLDTAQRRIYFREELFPEDVCLFAVSESYWFGFLVGFQA